MIKQTLLYTFLLPLLLFGNEDILQLELIPSKNLLKNFNFVTVKSINTPAFWPFDNCSKSPSFKTEIKKHHQGNYLSIYSDWQKFGYHHQKVAVTPGVSYHASVEVQSAGPTPALWLKSINSKINKSKSRPEIEFIAKANLYHSDEMKEALKDFVDEKLIRTLNTTTWNKIGKAIKIPKTTNVTYIDVNIGILGGDAGFANFKNPVFRESKATLKITFKGKNHQKLIIKGAKPESIKLDTNKNLQTVFTELPIARRIYTVELYSDGKRITKEVINE